MTKEKVERISKGLLTAGEIAKLCGVLRSTVKYYTDIGLLKVKSYSQGGHRLYDKKKTLERIKKIRQFYSGKETLKEKIKKVKCRRG